MQEFKYNTALELLKHYEQVFYNQTSIYAGLSIPLFALSWGVHDLGREISILAAFVGFILGVTWWASASRIHKYVYFYIDVMMRLERESGGGLMLDEAAYFTRRLTYLLTPNGLRMRVWLIAASAVAFLISGLSGVATIAPV